MGTCPFCDVEEAVLSNALAYARFDKYPVNSGHLLILPRRHVAGYFEASASERAALIELLDAGKTLLDQRFRPDGYNYWRQRRCGRRADHRASALAPDPASPR